MEKPNKTTDHKTKEYLVEAGLERPSLEFTNKVMDQITHSPLSMNSYQPLISQRGWWVVAFAITASALLLYFFPINTWEQLRLDGMFAINNASLQWNLGKPSKTVVYGIFFVGLFLVQIPFLKRLHDKNII